MPIAFVLLLLLAVTAPAQDPSAAADTEAAQPTVLDRWKITVEQYYLIDPSRRPGGETYKYWRERKRGPYGNLLEHVPGGPRRPVKP